MEIIYVADDGKQFYNEDDCLNYELTNKLKGLYCYDKSKKRIILDEEFNPCRTEVYYLLADSYESLETFNELCEMCCASPIPYVELGADYSDLFFWSDLDNEWHSWTKDCEELKEMGEFFQMTPVF